MQVILVVIAHYPLSPLPARLLFREDDTGEAWEWHKYMLCRFVEQGAGSEQLERMAAPTGSAAL